MNRPTRAFWGMTVGVLLLELAWVLALPAFRGLDEFAHVFRADSLANGQLLSRAPAADGPGHLVSVRDDVADAARSQCMDYDYTSHDDCRPAAKASPGRVYQSSTASSYDPVWYAVVGVAARPFDGAAADFAMRLASALVTALLAGWAAAVLARWDSTGWTQAGLVVVMTPIAVYSGAVAAPNGVGYGAAVLFWAAALTLVETPRRPPLVALVVSASVMAHTHTTGVLWLAVAAVALLLLRGPAWWFRWFAADPRPRWLAAGLVLLGGVTAFVWIKVAGTNTLGQPYPGVGLPTVPQLLGQQLVWFFQTIGAFPDRTTPAPLAVYALWVAPLALLLAAGVRRADPRQRRALAWLATCWIAVPMILTLISYRSESFAWQGRYALPLVDGIVLLAAWSVARSANPPTPRLLAVAVMTAVAHAWSAAVITHSQAGRGLGFAVADHLPHATLLVTALALVGGLLPGLLGAPPPSGSSRPGRRTRTTSPAQQDGRVVSGSAT